MKKIYIAAPFYNRHEKGILNKVTKILKRKKLITYTRIDNNFNESKSKEEVFRSNLQNIESSNILLVINSKGKNDDTESFWEVGYAYAKNIPIILFYQKDERISVKLIQSARAYLLSFEELIDYNFDELEEVKYKGTKVY